MSDRSKASNRELLRESIDKTFPISAPNEYETVLNQSQFPIGIDHHYPVELRERLTAATISYLLQNKSIDYTRKRYLGDLSYEKDPGGELREDRRIRTACLSFVNAQISGLVRFREGVSEDATMGEFLSDATLIRIPYSLERAFAEGDKGALFEALVITRMSLEQLCWAINIRHLKKPDEIKNTSVTKSITKVSKKYPKAGRLNGWLSNHAHWGYDAHVKTIVDVPGQVMKSSSLFKGCAYIALIVFSDLFVKVMSAEVGDYIASKTVSLELESRSGLEDFDFDHEYVKLKEMLIPFYPDLTKLG